MAVDPPYKTRQRKKRAFLAAYAETGNVTRAAEIVGCARTRHYEWLKDDPVYAADFVSVEDHAGDRLEQEARRRAMQGVAKPVFYKGDVVGTIQEYSDTLLIFLLKASRPEKYSERHKVESTVNYRREAAAIAAEIGKADDPALVAQIEADLQIGRDRLLSQEAR